MYCCAVLHLQHHVLLGCAASAAPCTAALCCVCSTMYCCTMLRLQHHVQLRCAVQPLLCLLAASSAPQMANMGQIGRAARYYTDPSPHHGLSLLTWSTCESGGGSLDPEPGAHVSHRGAPGQIQIQIQIQIHQDLVTRKTGQVPVPSVFVCGNFGNFKLKLKPAGCCKILQKIQGDGCKTQEIPVFLGGPPTTSLNILND